MTTAGISVSLALLCLVPLGCGGAANPGSGDGGADGPGIKCPPQGYAGIDPPNYTKGCPSGDYCDFTAFLPPNAPDWDWNLGPATCRHDCGDSCPAVCHTHEDCRPNQQCLDGTKTLCTTQRPCDSGTCTDCPMPLSHSCDTGCEPLAVPHSCQAACDCP